VGWALADHLRTELATDALQMALNSRRPAPGLIHHSDRGGQYLSATYIGQLAAYGIRSSVGRTGTCFDNTAARELLRHAQIRAVAPRGVAHPTACPYCHLLLHPSVSILGETSCRPEISEEEGVRKIATSHADDNRALRPASCADGRASRSRGAWACEAPGVFRAIQTEDPGWVRTQESRHEKCAAPTRGVVHLIDLGMAPTAGRGRAAGSWRDPRSTGGSAEWAWAGAAASEGGSVAGRTRQSPAGDRCPAKTLRARVL